MIELQMHTLWIWIVRSEVLFAALLAIVWSLRRTEQALVYWALASACLALASVGASQLADTSGVALAAGLFVLSMSLRWAGLRQFDGRRKRWGWYLGPPLLVLGLLLPWSKKLGLGDGSGVVLSAALGGSYALLMSADTYRAQRDEHLAMRWIVIVTGGLTVLLEAGILAQALGTPAAQHFPVQNTVNAGILIGLLSVFTLYDFGCFLLVFERIERRLVRDATVDSLTNVLNRIGFGELADRVLLRCLRDRCPVSVMVMDLDHFKRVNDGYGHEAGDAVLRAFAQAARAALRPTDLLARPGGEEFWAVIPHADLAEACRSGQRVCDRFRDVRVPFEGHSIAATVSIGVAEVNRAGETIHSAIGRADQALYESKSLGRDRVTAAGAAPVRP